MNATNRMSMSSAQEAHEDSGSSDYENKGRPTQDLDEEKAIGLDGAEHPPTKEQDIAIPGKGRNQSRRSQDNKSLKSWRGWLHLSRC
jgi:hypothetical protein